MRIIRPQFFLVAFCCYCLPAKFFFPLKGLVGTGGIFGRRSLHIAILVALTGLFVIGCSVSMTDRTSKDSSRESELLDEFPLSVTRQSQSPNKNFSVRPPFTGNYKRTGSVEAQRSIFDTDFLMVAEDDRFWQEGLNGVSSPVLIDSFPPDLADLDVVSKKRVFVGYLLPVVMVAFEEIRKERDGLLALLSKIEKQPNDIFFSAKEPAWKKGLSVEEITFVQGLTRKYRHVNAAQLLERIDVLPVSLVIAQSAIESSWGVSRFASLGNNLFGMWTWGEKGIVPLDREEGKSHKVAVYDSILQSVQAYMLTINRLPAYQSLRDIRAQTSDPISLSEGLINYSERRAAYVDDLQLVIRYNRLNELDGYRLASL